MSPVGPFGTPPHFLCFIRGLPDKEDEVPRALAGLCRGMGEAPPGGGALFTPKDAIGGPEIALGRIGLK